MSEEAIFVISHEGTFTKTLFTLSFHYDYRRCYLGKASAIWRMGIQRSDTESSMYLCGEGAEPNILVGSERPFPVSCSPSHRTLGFNHACAARGSFLS